MCINYYYIQVGSFFFFFKVYKHAQSCPMLCNPMNCSPPGSSVHGISRARIQEWVTISSSRGSFRPRNLTCVACIAEGFFTTEPPGRPFSRAPTALAIQDWQRSHRSCKVYGWADVRGSVLPLRAPS